MSARTKNGLYSTLSIALLLVLISIIGFSLEGAGAQHRPDSVGHGLPWFHDRHARNPAFKCQNCQVCHHTSKAGQVSQRSCGDINSSCHPTTPDLGQPQPLEVAEGKRPPPDRRSVSHKTCVGCHKAVSLGPQECAECHQPGHGTKSCGGCHRDTFEELVEGGHATVACESCHTAVAAIIENDKHPVHVPRAETRVACLTCHGDAEPDTAGFPRKLFSKCPVSESTKRPSTKQCLECHQPHSPHTTITKGKARRTSKSFRVLPSRPAQ